MVIKAVWFKDILTRCDFLFFARLFFYLFVFFIPFRIDALISGREVFLNGFFNPYLSHYIYLSDVFLLIGFLFLGLYFIFQKKDLSVFSLKFDKLFVFLVTLFVGSYFLSLIFSVDRLNTLFYCFRSFEFYLFFLLFAFGVLNFSKVVSVFLASVGLVAIVGIFQYFLQHSVGLFSLGEPNISSDMKGLAKIDLSDEKSLRIYGTFAHPNLFAGYLMFAFYFILYLWNQRKTVIWKWSAFILIFLVLCTLLLTFSRVAIITVLIGIIFYLLTVKKKFFVKYLFGVFFVGFLLINLFGLTDELLSRFYFSDSSNLQERTIYFQIAEGMFLEHPFGVGVGNFTTVMQEFYQEKLDPWLFQPVHNIYVLIITEVGFLGFIIFAVLIFYGIREIFKNYRYSIRIFLSSMMFLSVLFVGLFDHYFFTLYQGQFLLWISLIFLNSEISLFNLSNCKLPVPP